jgi:hypothetical protein
MWWRRKRLHRYAQARWEEGLVAGLIPNAIPDTGNVELPGYFRHAHWRAYEAGRDRGRELRVPVRADRGVLSERERELPAAVWATILAAGST